MLVCPYEERTTRRQRDKPWRPRNIPVDAGRQDESGRNANHGEHASNIEREEQQQIGKSARGAWFDGTTPLCQRGTPMVDGRGAERVRWMWMRSTR